MNQYEINPLHQHFTISGSLPSLNEYLAACNKNPRIGNSLKAKSKFIVNNAIRRFLKRYHTDNPIIIHYHIYEQNMKRDKDNVFAMISKTVQDSLQECNVIDNDGWKNVENFTHDFYVSKDNPRIEVYIEEIK